MNQQATRLGVHVPVPDPPAATRNGTCWRAVCSAPLGPDPVIRDHYRKYCSEFCAHVIDVCHGAPLPTPEGWSWAPGNTERR